MTYTLVEQLLELFSMRCSRFILHFLNYAIDQGSLDSSRPLQGLYDRLPWGEYRHLRAYLGLIHFFDKSNAIIPFLSFLMHSFMEAADEA